MFKGKRAKGFEDSESEAGNSKKQAVAIFMDALIRRSAAYIRRTTLRFLIWKGRVVGALFCFLVVYAFRFHHLSLYRFFCILYFIFRLRSLRYSTLTFTFRLLRSIISRYTCKRYSAIHPNLHMRIFAYILYKTKMHNSAYYLQCQKST